MKTVGMTIAGHPLSGTGGLTLLGALLLWIFLRFALPAEQRPRLRPPALFLALYLLVTLIRGWLPAGAASTYLGVAGLLFLLLAVGRLMSSFLLEWLFGSRLGRVTPKIVRDIFEAVIVIAALIATLRSAGVDPTSLLTTSALLTAIVGLSLQDTLGNLFAGLSLQAQQPFQVGDWVQYDAASKQVGQVVEINWRATRLLTNDLVELIIPNGQLARAVLFNYSRPTPESRRSLYVTVPHDVPTHRVQHVLAAAVATAPGVLPNPPPTVLTHAFEERGITYWVRYFMNDYARRDLIDSDVRDRMWYALQRAQIPIAMPAHRVELFEKSAQTRAAKEATRVSRRADALRAVDFLRDLPDTTVDSLAPECRTELYREGELVVRQGEAGDALYICMSGELAVIYTSARGERREIARLGVGSLFGELSLMTGQARSASVQALGPCELLVLGKDTFARVLADNRGIAEQISQRLAERQAALGALPEDAGVDNRASVQEHQGQFLQRIREFFSL